MPSRTPSDDRILLELLKENCGVGLKTLKPPSSGQESPKQTWEGRVATAGEPVLVPQTG